MDIFNASSGRWSTAVLKVARNELAATSLPNQGLAIFAGGSTGCDLWFTVDDVACCMCCDGGKDGRGACVGFTKLLFEPPLPIANAVVQALAVAPVVPLWIFLTAANPHVHRAQLAELLLQRHNVLFALQEHTPMLL